MSLSSKENGSSAGGKVAGTLFLLVFFAMGTLFEIFLIRDLYLSAQSYFWPKLECRIISSVVERGEGKDPYLFKVKYEYEYKGRAYLSERYQDATYSSSDYSKLQKLVEHYHAGSKAFCYVDPGNPETAILEHKSLWLIAIIPLPAIFILVGAGGIYGIWFYKPKSNDPMPKPGRLHSFRNKRLGQIGVIFLGMIFLAAGLLMTYHFSYRPISKLIRANSWPELPCKVVSGTVQSHDSDDGTTYSVDILYEYSFGGKTYRSNKYDFLGGSSSGHSAKQEIVERYLSMQNPVCHVDPADPGQAVLEKKLSWKYALCLFPLAFVIAGMAIIRAGLSSFRQKTIYTQDGISFSGDYLLRGTGNASEYRGSTDSDGFIVLKTQTPASHKLLGAVLICLFWNGIVSVFVSEMIGGFRLGRPQWFLTFFLIPFEIVGLCLLGAVVYQFLALFNPWLKLTLRPAILRPGTSAELEWEIHGRKERIKALTITLSGREESSYRRGTSSCTDKSTFFMKQLFVSQAFQKIEDGSAKFQIPAETMHSFEAESNKIIWEISVHGEIGRWPDVKQEHKIIVSPL